MQLNLKATMGQSRLEQFALPTNVIIIRKCIVTIHRAKF
jgi:hypothetical protein